MDVRATVNIQHDAEGPMKKWRTNWLGSTSNIQIRGCACGGLRPYFTSRTGAGGVVGAGGLAPDFNI